MANLFVNPRTFREFASSIFNERIIGVSATTTLNSAKVPIITCVNLTLTGGHSIQLGLDEPVEGEEKEIDLFLTLNQGVRNG